MGRSLPLAGLKTFEVAARLLSFKRAAQELNVTPTAVSHQIQNLEELLGTKLFRRLQPSGLELTSAGALALPLLHEGFGKLKAAVELIDSAGTGEILTVLAPPSFATRWLVPRLHRFAMRYPSIDVRVSTRMRQFGYRTLAGGGPIEADTLQAWCDELDVVVATGDGKYPGFASTPLFFLSITALCSPRLLDVSQLTYADLEKYPLLHDDRGLMLQRQSYWDIWLRAQGSCSFDTSPGMHFSLATLALEAAADGLGITVSTPALARGDLASGRLVKPFALEVPLQSGYHLVSNEQVGHRDAVKAFRSWAFEESLSEREHIALIEQ